ncbi:hypothetical protein LPJ59_001113 [Coemansia sp. RSA 2399]|nr:hypothetical protein LPJ59_001113 [Coemansia sp. RSA 2399]KAJ1907153.1 hypothetical protein LPJ81_000942 [Coemansia sp. IMI 209127]
MDSAAFRPDVESLFADHVKDADIVADINRANASMQMFSKAESVVNQAKAARVVFIECNDRETFLGSTRQRFPSTNAVDTGNGDTHALDRISIKYTPTTEMFCALLSAWHYYSSNAYRERSTDRKYEEEDFILWGDGDDKARLSAQDKAEPFPDYIFIDGIDKIASADR